MPTAASARPKGFRRFDKSSSDASSRLVTLGYAEAYLKRKLTQGWLKGGPGDPIQGAHGGSTTFHDLIHGDITFPNAALDDFVLISLMATPPITWPTW